MRVDFHFRIFLCIAMLFEVDDLCRNLIRISIFIGNILIRFRTPLEFIGLVLTQFAFTIPVCFVST